MQKHIFYIKLLFLMFFYIHHLSVLKPFSFQKLHFLSFLQQKKIKSKIFDIKKTMKDKNTCSIYLIYAIIMY